MIGGYYPQELLAIASFLILSYMLLMALFNTWTAPRAEALPAPKRFPRVSFMVPCRDEEVNLPVLAEHLAALRYPGLEIIVLDDHSTDGTPAALQELAAIVGPKTGSKVRVLRGEPLPPGWLGKSWACHQMSKVATGEIFIFCDADARPGPLAVERTVSLLENHGADAATFMPRQFLGTWSEKAVIPVLLHVSLFCFLPMALVPRFSWRKLGVGNGQWLSFRREAYEALGGHEAVRAEVVEDIALAQRVQTSGQRLVVALAARTLEVRMYRNFREVWEGFGKNLFILTGGRLWSAPFVGLFFALIHILPWALFPFRPDLWAAPLLLLAGCRLLTAHGVGDPAGTLIHHFTGALLVPAIAVRSLRDFRRKRLTWKGRTLS
jgi:chlorobactene glucosyltransferase